MHRRCQTRALHCAPMETAVQQPEVFVVQDLGGPSWFAWGPYLFVQDTGSEAENAEAFERALRWSLP
jgi:hypothetical protein